MGVREAVDDVVVQVLVSHVSHIAEDVHNSPGKSISFTPFFSIVPLLSSLIIIYTARSWPYA